MTETVYLTRRETFSASHRLHSNALSAADNEKIFGKCNNPHGHGHNYVLNVTVKAPIDSKTGMSFSLSEFKKVLKAVVLEKLDHKHLNLDVPEFKDLNPTTENLAVVIWHYLRPALPKGILYEVKVSETEKNSVCYRGPGPS